MSAKPGNSKSSPAERVANGSQEPQDDADDPLAALRRRFDRLCGVLRGVYFEGHASAGDPSSARLDFLGPSAEEFFGMARQAILDRPQLLWDLVHTDDRQRLAAIWSAGLPVQRCEIEFRMCLPSEAGAKRARWVRLVAAPGDADAHSYRGIVEDIADRKASEESIRSSERQLRQLAENIKEMFWVSEVSPRKIIYVSPAYEDIWGRSCRSLYENASSFLDGVHPDDRQRVEDSLPTARLGGYDQVYRVVHTDGSIRIVRARAFPVRDENGVVYRIAGIGEDITERKQVEEQSQGERRFLEHLLHVQEGERKLVAYDIHDGFLQSVIAAVMHLEALGLDPLVLERTRKKLELPFKLLRDAIEEARRMISGLRPPIIDEQGLVASIEYLINEFPAQSTRVAFDHSADFPRLDGVIEGTLFRIVQEALNNVRRHSQAKTAHITLSRIGDHAMLVVEDSGVGFDPRKLAGRQFGVRGIEERARLFGGRAEIRSTPGSGTRVTVELPLRLAREEASGA